MGGTRGSRRLEKRTSTDFVLAKSVYAGSQHKTPKAPVCGKARRGRGEEEEGRLLLDAAVRCPLISGHHNSSVMNHYVLIGLSALPVLR